MASLKRLRRTYRAGRAALLGAVLPMNHSARNELGIAPDSIPHCDATPNHLRHLDAVRQAAEERRQRRRNQKKGPACETRDQSAEV